MTEAKRPQLALRDTNQFIREVVELARRRGLQKAARRLKAMRVRRSAPKVR